ncbi:helix-turn-helix transcriptional regulator [Bacillus sp. AFS088145]|uniref:helix-turn-helix domain-containing protein n=1 Tax=Bacillus sp. AFS088145 TaxID=2033514 RepID=UPI001155F877|nr:helix-turn-helix transcriptional regulator [Bacillus sp. AFS088145]
MFHKIMDHMKERNMNLTQLARSSSIHLTEISRILNHKQTLSLRNLDAITATFNLKEDGLYSDYVEECFNENGILDKRRSMEFLYKCALLGYKDQLKIIFNKVLDESQKAILKKNLNYIFLVAEKLFEEHKEWEALPLYECIIESMPDHNSIQLAKSYFRKYCIVRTTQQGHEAEVHVLRHLTKLTNELQLSTYLWIMATCYIRQNWKKVLYYAKTLEKYAKEGEHYGRALLYQGFALLRLGGSLEDVLFIIDRYSKVNEYFKDLAVGNRFVAYLEFEQYEHVDAYLDWLEGREDLFVGLPRILEIYVKLGRIKDVEHLLNRYFYIFEEIAESKEPFKQQMHLKFRYSHALYQCARNKITEGIHEILDVAITAIELGVAKGYGKCLMMYWNYRHIINSDHEQKYLQILSR